MDSAVASEARQEWTGRAHLKRERTSKEGRDVGSEVFLPLCKDRKVWSMRSCRWEGPGVTEGHVGKAGP